MLIRTHLAISFLVILFLIDFVDGNYQKFIFIFFVFISTFLPDIDSKNSQLGRFFIFRPFQFFVKHRDFVHSFLFMILIGSFIFLFSKIAFYGFAVGFGLHLIADCFNISGIRIFYPLKFKIKGFVKTNGILEWVIFSVAVIFGGWVLINNIFIL